MKWFTPPPPIPQTYNPREQESINACSENQRLVLLVAKDEINAYLDNLRNLPPGPVAGRDFSIKIRNTENLTEAHAINFVASKTSIPVPRILCAFIHAGKSYVVMEKITGHDVSIGWKTHRSRKSQAAIIRQLRSMMEELRFLRCPNGTGVSNVCGGPIRDHRLPARAQCSFASIKDFHSALVKGDSLPAKNAKNLNDLTELFSFYKAFKERPVFTHGNLLPKNVLVRGDEVVGIVGWEVAGWLPYYWEYTSSSFLLQSNESDSWWQKELNRFLTPLPREVYMEELRHRNYGYIR